MKIKLRILASILFFFFTTQSFSNPISEINFIGLNNASEESLLQLIPFKNGQEYTRSSSDGIIESLFETGLFSDISISNNENSLNITLKENPRIKYLKITSKSKSGWKNWLNSNNFLFTDDELKDFAKSKNISTGSIFSQNKFDDFISTIEKKYFNEGFYNADFEIISEIDVQNRIGIDIIIDQSTRAKIESFKVSGSSVFSNDELLKLFAIGEPDFAPINYFTSKDNFSDEKFRFGLDSITQKYFNSGYLDFKIINVSIDLNDSKDKISVNIQVSEGVQYKLGKVSFDGELGGFSVGKLTESLSISTGDIFNRELIMKDIQTLIDLYADQGYAFIDINPVTSDFIDTVNVSFLISLNKKTYINRITISGNTRTQDQVIRREINIAEGGLYSRSSLRESVDRLRRLGYFSDVQMNASEVKGVPDKIDLNFIVEETQTGAISFSVSHSNNYGISLGAGIEEKNIFGSGNTLNAELKLSESYNKISFYFMNPNYNDEGHSISIGAFKSQIDDDEVAKNSYEIDSTGISLGYGIPLTKNTRINTDIEFSKNIIKCSDLFSSTSYESKQCSKSNRDELKFNTSWNENTLNNYLYPTKGVNNSLSASIALPGGDYKYFNLSANHTSYSPINDNLTLKLTGNLNLSKGYGGKELPFYKRHFGGGSGSIRGFGSKSLGPEYPNGKAKGGEISILGSTNLITPAYFFEDNDKMRMSVFIDAGNVFEKSSKIELDQIRMSAGIGFAYLSPIGSIGGFISTPILKKSGDTTENFGFSIGTGF